MAKSWNYSEDKKRITIEPPKQRLGISGHRLSGVLGLDPYTSPFQMWCECTKLVKKPFEETKYIIAGRAAESKIIKYVADRFPNVISIEEYYGNIFNEYRYNNFKDDDLGNIFSGVIDAVSVKNDGRTIAMICECKTSSHPEHWANNTIPVAYALQGALYSYLKGLDRVLFACTFLTDMDYAHPEDIEVNDSNTILRVVKLEDLVFEVNGEYLNIEGCIQYAINWWNEYVLKGISPEFDEKQDKEYLKIIRATDATKDTELEEVCKQAIAIARDIANLKEDAGINSLEKELKSLETSIKNKMIEDDISSCGDYKLTKSVRQKFNEKLFADENEKLYNKYIETTESYTLSKNKKKDEEEGE